MCTTKARERLASTLVFLHELSWRMSPAPTSSQHKDHLLVQREGRRTCAPRDSGYLAGAQLLAGGAGFKTLS